MKTKLIWGLAIAVLVSAIGTAAYFFAPNDLFKGSIFTKTTTTSTGITGATVGTIGFNNCQNPFINEVYCKNRHGVTATLIPGSGGTADLVLFNNENANNVQIKALKSANENHFYVPLETNVQITSPSHKEYVLSYPTSATLNATPSGTFLPVGQNHEATLSNETSVLSFTAQKPFDLVITEKFQLQESTNFTVDFGVSKSIIIHFVEKDFICDPFYSPGEFLVDYYYDGNNQVLRAPAFINKYAAIGVFNLAYNTDLVDLSSIAGMTDMAAIIEEITDNVLENLDTDSFEKLGENIALFEAEEVEFATRFAKEKFLCTQTLWAETIDLGELVINAPKDIDLEEFQTTRFIVALDEDEADFEDDASANELTYTPSELGEKYFLVHGKQGNAKSTKYKLNIYKAVIVEEPEEPLVCEDDFHIEGEECVKDEDPVDPPVDPPTCGTNADYNEAAEKCECDLGYVMNFEENCVKLRCDDEYHVEQVYSLTEMALPENERTKVSVCVPNQEDETVIPTCRSGEELTVGYDPATRKPVYACYESGSGDITIINEVTNNNEVKVEVENTGTSGTTQSTETVGRTYGSTSTVAEVDFSACPNYTSRTIIFSDIGRVYVKNEIMSLTECGVFNGYPDGEFKTFRGIIWAEWIATLYRSAWDINWNENPPRSAAGYSLSAEYLINNPWYENAVNSLINAKILSAYPASPQISIRTADAIKLAVLTFVKATDLTISTAKMEDVEVNGVTGEYEDYVKIADYYGIWKAPRSNGEIVINNRAGFDRGMAAVMAANLVQAIEENQ